MHPLAEMMGRVLCSPEVFNCNAPDTGNMEVFMNYASKAQQDEWLTPLLNGEIRSCYAMTEPQVASSDATNVETSIVREGNEWVLNGRKWFITGAMYERSKIIIVMGKSDPDNPDRHKQRTQVLVSEIQMARLLVFKTSQYMDDAGAQAARDMIAASKTSVPLMVQTAKG